MELCRVCMHEESEMAPMFNNGDANIVEMIQYSTGILFTKDENLPSKICKKCLDELKTAHKFKTKCVSSEHTFQELIQKVKEEPENTIYNEDTLDYDVKDDVIEGYSSPCKVEVKYEETVVECSVRKSKRVQLKQKNDNSKANPKKKRGKYNKPGKPRILKYKYRKLYCEPCDIKFKSKKESDDHKQEYHKGEQNWVCEICGKVFNYRASHLTHMRSHFPPKFACDQCDYKSYNKYDLVKHVRVHTGVKAYKCTQCPAAYNTVSNLRAHGRLVHERLRPHACQLCGKAFYDRTKLNRHLDTHNDIKRHCCEICHSCFARRCYLKKHLLKQHNVTMPPLRPGRQKANLVIDQLITGQNKLVYAVEG